MAAHDFRHLYPVRRTAGRSVDHLGQLTEILRTYRSRRDHAQRLSFLGSVVIKPVNGAAPNT